MTDETLGLSHLSAESLPPLILANISEYAIFVIDRAQQIQSWNPGVERLFGYSEQEFVGQPFKLIFTPQDQSEKQPLHELETAAQTGRAGDNRWHQRKDNSLFWANGIVTTLKNETGDLQGFVKIVRDATERKQMEDSLRETKERISNILEAIPSAFYAIDTNWKCTYVNRKAELFINQSRESLIGKNVWEMFPEAIGGEVYNNLQSAMRERKDLRFDAFYPPINKHLEIHAHPTPEGLAVYYNDITQQKEHQVGVERYAEIIRNMPIGVYLWQLENRTDSNSLRLIAANPASVAATGLGVEQVEGLTIDEAFPTTVQTDLPDIYRQIALTGETRDLGEIRTTDPRIENEFFSLKAVGLSGESVAVLFENVTERKHAEEERTRLLEQERAARSEAENANRLKDEFLATLSHELRTPLNAIMGWSQMLVAGKLPEETVALALDAIKRNARAQNQLIEDLLDVSRIITGKLRLDVRPVDLSQVIFAATDAVRPAAEAKNIRLQTLLDPAAGQISGDPDRLQQVVWNLLSNAIKFTPEGGRVEIRLERIDSHVEIVVNDTGKGIAPEFLPFIFDRFRQADSSTTRVYGGLGLGLAIVRQLIDLHGGTVTVESAGENMGATFKIGLPLLRTHVERRRTAEPLHAPIPNGTLAQQPELENLSLLIVDDEPDARELLITVLVSYGATVKTADSASEAIRLIEQEHFDVLISDIGMPDEDGYSLIAKVRALDKSLPAVALTAYARAEDRVRVLRAGFQMHMPKPVEPAELIAAIVNVTRRN